MTGMVARHRETVAQESSEWSSEGAFTMVIARRTRLNLANVSERLVPSLTWLDKPAAALHKAFDPILGANGVPIVKDALYGTWLGHPLHPVLTDLPIGFWTSSMVFDVVGKKKAADLMLKLGTVTAVGTAVTGVAQWHDLQEMKEPRRVGMLHALLNVAATSCYGVSWALRSQRARSAAKVFSTTGFALATGGGLLGGDLSYRLGIGVSRVAFEEPSGRWRAVDAVTDLEDGVLKRVESKAGPIVLLKDGDVIHAASATCTHVGGPLEEGERDGACVTCPWHGSVFDLRDGHVVHGPATTPLHAYETRVANEKVEIRPMQA
jgi:nitrite reductase/ring-hydroxylating ferredoxin subunit/uncharacterized membrane protein